MGRIIDLLARKAQKQTQNEYVTRYVHAPDGIVYRHRSRQDYLQMSIDELTELLLQEALPYDEYSVITEIIDDKLDAADDDIDCNDSLTLFKLAGSPEFEICEHEDELTGTTVFEQISAPYREANVNNNSTVVPFRGKNQSNSDQG